MLISIELFGCFPFYLHSKRTIIGPVNELLLHFRYKWCSLLKIWPNIHCNIITPLDCCVWFKIHSSHKCAGMSSIYWFYFRDFWQCGSFLPRHYTWLYTSGSTVNSSGGLLLFCPDTRRHASSSLYTGMYN